MVYAPFASEVDSYNPAVSLIGPNNTPTKILGRVQWHETTPGSYILVHTRMPDGTQNKVHFFRYGSGGGGELGHHHTHDFSAQNPTDVLWFSGTTFYFVNNSALRKATFDSGTPTVNYESDDFIFTSRGDLQSGPYSNLVYKGLFGTSYTAVCMIGPLTGENTKGLVCVKQNGSGELVDNNAHLHR
jgi:hypothetical protein